MQITLLNHSDPNMEAEAIFHSILARRGFANSSSQAEFLSPKEPTLASLMKDSGITKEVLESVRRVIDSHLDASHDLCVFGDYDADGITATSVLWQAMIQYARTRLSKSRILPFLPDRRRHGYGLSTKAVDEISSGQAFQTTTFPNFSPSLIITVDNGIVAHEAAGLMAEKGIDLIITDHHEPLPTLPIAKAVVHSTVTSGAGIAWILSLYLLGKNQFSKDLIDLATIGIVADMMPLHGTNRGIVVHGLKQLADTTRPGLLALYAAAKIEPKKIQAYTIGFSLAPRINAAGRLYDPYDALRLLCATKSESAEVLAKKIDSHNRDRQDLTEVVLGSVAKESFTHKVVVVIGDYHEGIIGLVAGKLTELTHKPSIVISNHGDSLKGSARSVPGVNITELLRALPVTFLSLGGHSQAAGFGLDASDKDLFLSELYGLADTTILDSLLEPVIKVDLDLSPLQVTLPLARLLSSLEPFGIGNPKPKFLFRDIDVVEDRRLGSDGRHRKLIIESGSGTLEVLLFNTKEIYPLVHLRSLVATIDINVWNSRETVQLIGSYVEL